MNQNLPAVPDLLEPIEAAELPGTEEQCGTGRRGARSDDKLGDQRFASGERAVHAGEVRDHQGKERQADARSGERQELSSQPVRCGKPKGEHRGADGSIAVDTVAPLILNAVTDQNSAAKQTKIRNPQRNS